MPNKSEKRGRGRPAFQPTPALRRKVSIAAGGGMLHQDIAIALGINVDTLRKYFEDELSVGAAMRRMEALEGVHRAAKRGSSSAAKVYLANEPQMAIPPGGDAPAAQPAAEASAEPAKKLGKKEQATADAATSQVGTEWDDVLPRFPATGGLPH